MSIDVNFLKNIENYRIKGVIILIFNWLMSFSLIGFLAYIIFNMSDIVKGFLSSTITGITIRDEIVLFTCIITILVYPLLEAVALSVLSKNKNQGLPELYFNKVFKALLLIGIVGSIFSLFTKYVLLNYFPLPVNFLEVFCFMSVFLLTLKVTVVVWGDYNQIIKQLVIANFLDPYTGLSYNLGDVPPYDSDFNKLPIIPEYEFVASVLTDVIAGTYNDKAVSALELNLQVAKDTVVFKGLLFNFKAEKTFKGKLIITKKSFELKETYKKYKNLATNNEKFNEIFFVCTDNEEEAQNFLSQELIDKLLELFNFFQLSGLQKKHKLESGTFQESALLGSAFNCCFIENNFYIAVPIVKNLFEFNNIFIPLYNSRKINNTINELNCILKVFDLFCRQEKLLQDV